MTPHHRSTTQPGPGAANSYGLAVEPAPVLGAGIWANVGRAMAELARPFVRRHREWSDIRELRSLSDATLKDIGVSRSEIPGLVRRRYEEREPGRHA